MRLQILDRKGDNWVLGKVTLLDYLDDMTQESFNYIIQRGIVTNKYLDTILEAIGTGSAIPPISLIAKGDVPENETEMEVRDFNILDGLQRTYRLWIYLQLAKLAEQHPNADYRVVTDNLRKEEPSFSKAISTRQIRALFKQDQEVNVRNLKQLFSQYHIYIYLWLNLPEKEAIKKMLILNAGQKRMPIQNQYELMYLHTFEQSRFEMKGVELIRTKDEESYRVKKGERRVGQYIVPSVIIGLQSFISGKPVRLSDELLYSTTSDFADEYITEKDVDLFFDDQFIMDYVVNLHRLDVAICTDDEQALRWFSKDTALSGIMGGIGRFLREKYHSDEEFSNGANTDFLKLTDTVFQQGVFKLDDYDRQYASLSSIRINIGMIVRKAISEYTYLLLTDRYAANWNMAFDKALERKRV